MLDCDDVFDVLTRGPFPTGKSVDRLVDQHLVECAACRRLAEALRPAVELLRESVAPEEGRDLPSYAGPSFWDQMARGAGAATGVRRPPPSAGSTLAGRGRNTLPVWPVTWPRPSPKAATLAAAVLVGLSLGIVLAGLFRGRDIAPWGDGPAPGPQFGQTAPADSWSMTGLAVPSDTRRLELLAARLPANCAVHLAAAVDLPVSLAANPATPTAATGDLALLDSGSSHDVRCCKGCHLAGAAASVVRSRSAVAAQSCLACH